jgi:predicted nuclease of predicted toxin-antitoxin system
LKLLLDSCVSRLIHHELVSKGHDTVWVGSFSKDPGDEEILTLAFREERILVTLDKDFGELAVVMGRPHTGIIRLVNLPLRLHASTCERILELHGRELQLGAMITAEPGRLRIRPPRET